MNVQEWIDQTTRQFKNAGIASARLDALVLLEDAAGRDRAWLLAHPESTLENQTVKKLKAQIERRTAHEPLAYIRGRSEFYGREFSITPATLQPRPETETMVELLLDQVRSKEWQPKSIVDIGTGSGAIAITAKLELPELAVYATEINADALKIARQNAKNLHAEIAFYKGNLLEPLLYLKPPISHPVAIVANLPYVPDRLTINEAAMHEPEIAIFGGTDGLDLYRQMFAQITGSKYQIPNILTESLPFQHQALAEIAGAAGYSLVITDDFIQAFVKS